MIYATSMTRGWHEMEIRSGYGASDRKHEESAHTGTYRFLMH